MQRLFDLAEKGYVRILMPEITENEWLKHFRENTKIPFADIERKTPLFGIPETDGLLKKYKSMVKEYEDLREKAFKTHMDRAKVIRLRYDYAKNQISKVFGKYFAQEKPFGPKGKKDEFPDAFVLVSLEKYAKENKLKKIIVISTDNDMKEYPSDILQVCEPINYLNEINTVKIPASSKLKKPELKKVSDDVVSLMSYVSGQPFSLMKRIKGEVEEYLSDIFVYSERFSYVDIEYVDIKHIKVDGDAKSLQILSIEEESIEASFDVDVEAVVGVTHFDEENSIWDSEEKDFLFRENTSTELRISSRVPVTIIAPRPEEGYDKSEIMEDTEIKNIDFFNLQDAIDYSPSTDRPYQFS